MLANCQWSESNAGCLRLPLAVRDHWQTVTIPLCSQAVRVVIKCARTCRQYVFALTIRNDRRPTR